MSRHREPLTPEEEARIVKVLTETECTFNEIAARFDINQSTVVTINKNHQIRKYATHSRWTVGDLTIDRTQGIA